MTTTASGSAMALNYGFNWITGFRLNYRTLQNTNNTHLDWTRVGMWALGEGEMDGCEELWDSGLQRLLFTSENDSPATFHFHSGTDAVIGSGSAAVSSGGDQGVDSYWTSLPSGVQPLHYHRIAYYGLFLKLLINNLTVAVNQGEPSQWVDLNPVGLWRGIRCRLFDATGAMTGYAFTTNPAWQMVDLLLRRRLFVEYNLTQAGPDDLTAAVRNRFDWPSIVAAAAAYDTVMPNGQRQFEGNFSFSQQSTMQACLTQMLTCCRSYILERAGKIALYLDQPRGSVFTLSRKNASSFTANDSSIHSGANRFIAKFRDLQVPSAADIVSITTDANGVQVTTLNPHPFAKDDRILIGGTGTKYDSIWIVTAVPTGSSVYTLTLKTKGSNYPSSMGAGGKMGLTYARFKDRAPEFNHHAHQMAKGAIGVGIPRQRNKIKVETDFANSTYDQASRITQYQRARSLGDDFYTTPIYAQGTVPLVRPRTYIPPVFGEAELPLFAIDAAGSGNLAIGIEPGDVVTIDDTLDFQYAGTFEVLTATPQLSGSTPAAGGSLRRSPQEGKLTLSLGPYTPAAFAGDSSQTQAGWDVVLKSQPGNSSDYTVIPLADGIAAFFSGTGSDSATVSLPSAGFTAGNAMFWASPQGFIDGDGNQLHFIQNCDIDQFSRLLHMQYSNGNGNVWTGDLNYAGLAWRTLNSATATQNGEYTFVELTLAGGEKVCFGTGRAPASTAVIVPAGYSLSQAIVLAMPHTSSDTGNNAHGVRSYVDTSGIAHHDYYDGSGNHWEGDSRIFFFGWKNNRGSVSLNQQSGVTPGGITASGPSGWVTIPCGGKNLVVGGFTVRDSRLGSATIPNAPNTPLKQVSGPLPGPATVAATTTLQAMLTPDSFQIVDHPAHGVKECLVQSDFNVLTSFQDGEMNEWYGTASVFTLVCDVGPGGRSGGLHSG